MKPIDRYQTGDVVTHPRRPEWGPGVVKSAQAIVHQGTAAQRLNVEFANHGRVVINTAVAPLAPKGSKATMSSSITADKGWLDQLERSRNNSHELWDLPEALTDVFSSDLQRLMATLDTYKFSTEPRPLIDWAVMQTGLNDPLTKYTRHDLEQAFARFARNRDQHLKDLVRQLKRNGKHQVLVQAYQKCKVLAGKTALERAMRH
ncbi:MAG: hypothetical protein Kow00105_15410 [Phycisphaeraceae bacterium]